jgi:zinc protease
MKRVGLVLCSLFVAACVTSRAPVTTTSGAQVKQEVSKRIIVPTELDQPLPWDPDVRKGRLDNGLTWYVEPNPRPADRVELWLAVRVGSVHEDEDQRGLAHFVEHMAFNGTRHFPGNSLVTYLESVGTRFGAHLNAHTSFEETIYKLQVPTDDDDLLDKGFLVLRDWASAMSMDEREIEDERGVVFEEWRRSRGASGRRWEAVTPLRFMGAPHAERRPIGTKESLETFSPGAARRFYADWYRPDLMAVVVVGDIDPDDAQRRIKEAFGLLENPLEARPRPDIEIPGHDETLVSVFKDPEEQRTVVSVLHKLPDREENTHRAYRDRMVQTLWQRGLQERLSDLGRDPEAPFQNAGVGNGRMNPTTGSQSGWAVAKDGRALDALDSLMVELERARRHGLTKGELSRAQKGYAESMRKAFVERDTGESRSVLQELIRNFTNGENVPGIAYEWAMTKAWLSKIKLDEVNAYGATWMGPDSRLVSLSMPDKDGGEQVTEDDVREVLDSIPDREIGPPVIEEVPDELMAKLPRPGDIEERAEEPEYGATILSLSNGATVIVKPTDFKAEEIRFRSWSWGGTSIEPDDRWIAATTATAIASQSGIGELSRSQLNRFLAGRRASVRPYIGETVQGLSGSTSPKDLETAMQLLHLSFVAPRFTDDGFELVRSRQMERIANRGLEPSTPFYDRFNELLWQGHPRTAPPSMGQIDKMDLDASEAIYERAFGGVEDMTFVFVGAVDMDTFEPLVERYIGSLPRGETQDFVDVGKRYAEDARADSIRKGIEPKARVRVRVVGEFDSTPENRHKLRALGSTLSILLREDLREARGGTYSVGARTADTHLPQQRYSVTVDFQCDPDRVYELRKAAWQILEQVRAGPVEPSVTERVAEQQRRSWETELKTNSYWLGAIQGNLQRGDDPELLAEYRTWHERITPEYVWEAAAMFLDLNRYVLVTLLPEGAD